MEFSTLNASVESTSFINDSSVRCSGDIKLFARPADAIIIFIIAIFILAANSLNLVILWTTPSLRNVHGYLLTALTVGEFGIGCLAALVVYPVWAGCWPYGESFCLFSAYFAHVLLTYNLSVINLLNSERYIAICHPLRYRIWITKKRTLVTILVTLLLSFTSYFVPVVTGYMDTVFVSKGYFCLLSVHDIGSMPVSLAFICVVMVPSVVIIGITSVVLLRKIARRSRRLPYLSGSTRGKGLSSCPSPMLRRNNRLFVVSVLLMLTYFIWWVPFFTIVMIKRKNPDIISGTSWFIPLSLLLAFFVSPMCNTIIYMFTMKVFKERAKSLLAKLCCCLCAKVRKLKSKNFSQNESEFQSSAV